MWMMGYNEGCELNMWDNSFASRKLRPLVPRPMTTNSSNNNNVSTASSPPCLGRLHASDFFSLNHPLATMTDQNKRESSNAQPHVMVSSRWNPTPEQLRTLEELYRRGTRTPSADQIQHITAQLRRYGKIEGKNVFYWFQNHKARERQKRRRQILEAAPPSDHHQNDQDHPTHDVEIFDKKNSGTNRTGFEGEHVKNWPPSTNGSTIPSESESMSNGGGGGAAKAGVVTDQCRPNGWSQLVEEELQQQQQQQEQQRRSYIMERNATWQQMMNLSCPSPTNLLINTTADSTITTTMTATTPTLLPSEATTIRSSSSMDHKLLKSHDLNYIFIAPHARHNGNGLNGEAHGRDHPDHGHECEDGQTLQLFPLHESDCKDYSEASETNFNVPNYQFFEFLPLKN